MEGVSLTPEMAVSICKNGETLQVLNLKCSYLVAISSYAINYLQEIIECCQELKEVDMDYVNEGEGLLDHDLEFLAENISPNIEKLKLSSILIMNDHVEILLRRCNKIKVLSLEATTDDSLKNIRQCLNLTLEELSLGLDNEFSSTGFLELKSMPKLKVLNLYLETDDGEEIQNIRKHLPHLMIQGISPRLSSSGFKSLPMRN